MAKVLIHNTHGRDDVKRATLACVVANTALTAGQEAIFLLTSDDVWLATRGYTDGLQAKGFAPLAGAYWTPSSKTTASFGCAVRVPNHVISPPIN